MRMDLGSLIASSGGTHKLEHTYTVTCTAMDGDQKGLPAVFSALPPYIPSNLASSFAPCKFHFESNISQQHFHFVKTHFSCYLSYFCYKTCTGCLEQQQKIQYSIYM